MVTRYEDIGYDRDMIECKDGPWVDYADYKELLDKYEKLCQMVTEAWREID